MTVDSGVACTDPFVDADRDPANGCECIQEVQQEQRCDGLDEDCDGVPDDVFPELGNFCCAEPPGAPAIECERPSVVVCTADDRATFCPSDCRPARHDYGCNVHDDDCDGAVDEVEVGPVTPLHGSPDPHHEVISIPDRDPLFERPLRASMAFAADTDLDGRAEIHHAFVNPQAVVDPFNDDVATPHEQLDDAGGVPLAVRASRNGTFVLWLRDDGPSPLRLAQVSAADGRLNWAAEVPAVQAPLDAQLSEVAGGISVAWRAVVNGTVHVYLAVFDEAGGLRLPPTQVDAAGDGTLVERHALARVSPQVDAHATRISWLERAGRTNTVRSRHVPDMGESLPIDTLAQSDERIIGPAASATNAGAMTSWVAERRMGDPVVVRARHTRTGVALGQPTPVECLPEFSIAADVQMSTVETDEEVAAPLRPALTITDVRLGEDQPRRVHVITMTDDGADCAASESYTLPDAAASPRGFATGGGRFLTATDADGKVVEVYPVPLGAAAEARPLLTAPHRDGGRLGYAGGGGRHVFWYVDDTWVAPRIALVEVDDLQRSVRNTRFAVPRRANGATVFTAHGVVYFDGAFWVAVGEWTNRFEGESIEVVLARLDQQLRPTGDRIELSPRRAFYDIPWFRAVTDASGRLLVNLGSEFISVAPGSREVTRTGSLEAFARDPLEVRLDVDGVDRFETDPADADRVVHWRRFDWNGMVTAAADFVVNGQRPNDCRDLLAMRNHVVAVCQYPDEHLRSRLYLWPTGGGEPVFEDDVPEGNIAMTLFPYGPETFGLVHPNGPDATTFAFFDDLLGAPWLLPFDAARGSPDWPALFMDRGLMLWATLDRKGRVDVQPANCH
jgi:hypothetical protein